jgi:ABC-type multidrug transport system ATPase subunit
MNPPWRSIRGRQIKLLCADHGARHVVGLTGFRTSAARREVTAFADEVTILRRGKLAGYGRVADLQLYAPQSVDEVSQEPVRSQGGVFGAVAKALTRQSFS